MITPWTDGNGDQEEFALAVRRWCTFHDALSDANSNKIPRALRGSCLHSQLFDRTKDLCLAISDEELASIEEVEKIIGCVHH